MKVFLLTFFPGDRWQLHGGPTGGVTKLLQNPVPLWDGCHGNMLSFGIRVVIHGGLSLGQELSHAVLVIHCGILGWVQFLWRHFHAASFWFLPLQPMKELVHCCHGREDDALKLRQKVTQVASTYNRSNLQIVTSWDEQRGTVPTHF